MGKTAHYAKAIAFAKCSVEAKKMPKTCQKPPQPH